MRCGETRVLRALLQRRSTLATCRWRQPDTKGKMLYIGPYAVEDGTSAVVHSDARLGTCREKAQIIPQAKCDQ